MSNRKLKCFWGNLDGHYQGLVSASSRKEAAEIAGTSLYDFNNHWSEQPMREPVASDPRQLYVKKFDSNEPWRKKADMSAKR